MRTIVRVGANLEKAESRSSDPQIYSGSALESVTTGTVRYHSDFGEGGLHVFNGYSWEKLQSIEYTLNLSYETRHILDWARSKMAREDHLKNLCQNNQAVAKAYEKYLQAEEQLELLTILSEHA
jgi:hypothetical protein